MRKNITLKDVAKQAGVSYQTVSKVIRNEGQVTPAVRARIEQAIKELDYHPNAAAQNLRTKSSRLIGYSWHSKTGPVLEQFQHSIVECAQEFDYHILLFPHTTPNRSFATIYNELIHTRRVDGFILSSVEYNDPRLSVFQGQNVPVVSFGRSGHNEPQCYVDVDGRAGMRAAVRHLQAQGHQKIAVLAWPEESRVGTERLSGYWDAMTEAELPIDAQWIVHGTGEIDYGYSATRRLLNLPIERRPTAIATMIDMIAIGVMQAIEACGLQVGVDIAVTGFDDMPMAHHLKTGLTTLRQPTWDVGRAVVSALIAQIEERPWPTPQVLLSPELIIRDSSLRHPASRYETSVMSSDDV